jgi:hypothetical protein
MLARPPILRTEKEKEFKNEVRQEILRTNPAQRFRKDVEQDLRVRRTRNCIARAVGVGHILPLRWQPLGDSRPRLSGRASLRLFLVPQSAAT